MAQRPSYGRTASTNLGGTNSQRVLDGKVAIVTGIGAATCRLLASRGANLVMNYTSEKSTAKIEELAKQLESDHGIQTTIVQADMGSIKGPAHVVETAKNHFSHPKSGKFQLDIIINNAGVSSNHALADLTAEEQAEDFAFQYNVNVRGPLLLVKAAIPYLPHDRSGRIVNLSSVSASIGLPSQSIYGGTKAALDAMTRSWSRELAERATVNSINPGPVATDMYGAAAGKIGGTLGHLINNTPLMALRPDLDGEDNAKKFAEAGTRPGWDHEIAGIIGMIVSPDSAWATGSVFCANGGMVFTGAP
ncbi:short chain dehydrogenase [Pseudovirgaria hyperparasitica]|uniref:Short chain dehydrogenase n=1 Tax=Pseudovirgaria hyperparasitica TaxID=470096 RepID=A0A6A6W9Y9_9PEZI|nr:short chain dehydrogenase [Pseudovirgaria hyperparasitica]KAF2759678.1 short chain dehydrogenase [Pseudovirgaria hyperparasitica]